MTKKTIFLALSALLVLAAPAHSQPRGVYPKMVWKQLKWIQVTSPYTSDGRYGSYTTSDTTYLYRSVDTTTTTTAIDTTEAIDMSEFIPLLPAYDAPNNGTGGPFAVALTGTAVGTVANNDSVQVFWDTGWTPNGPWRSSTTPLFIIRASTGTYNTIYGKLICDINTASTSNPKSMIFAAPYIRLRFKSYSDTSGGWENCKVYFGAFRWEN